MNEFLPGRILKRSLPASLRFREGGISQKLKSRPFLLCCLIVLLLEAGVALMAPFVAPCDPNDINLSEKNSAPSLSHVMGTDYLGRDIFSRIIFGARTSLVIASVTVAFSFLIGVAVGALAAYRGGYVDEGVSRLIDIFLSFPGIIFALALIGLLGAGVFNLILALALSQWATYARLTRGQVLSVKKQDYVLSAKTIALPDYLILIRHVIPNAIPPILVLATLDIGHVILSTAALSFLGLGIPPDIPEWGSMISAGKEFIRTAPLNILFPGLAITVTVMLVNILGEGFRDLSDPRDVQVIA